LNESKDIFVEKGAGPAGMAFPYDFVYPIDDSGGWEQ